MKRCSFFLLLIFISNISYASFPVTNKIIPEHIVIPATINDSFNNLGWIAVGCLVLGCIFFVLQPILAHEAYIGGYVIIGMILGGIGGLLGLIWLFSRFKWGRKYWWVLLLGLFLIQIILEKFGYA